eukprot:CAMPEP_0180052426 /NCGR_PEP_ID=MMETSP0985-20121206/1729_1 /TAXON_ID=483367 /ORGANISM="non described non described, Strain CCMP 2436" /LENGTH=227 /DNA_ID=CAMNT_0021981835 /DNA_START=51 /DNA_END=731 /DNA_ORIENTATION=-
MSRRGSVPIERPLSPAARNASASQRAQRDKERMAQRAARRSGAQLSAGSYDPIRSNEIGRSSTPNRRSENGKLSFGSRAQRNSIFDERTAAGELGPGNYDVRDEIGRQSTPNRRSENGKLSFGGTSKRIGTFDEAAAATLSPGPGAYSYADPMSIAVSTSASTAKKGGTSNFHSSSLQRDDVVARIAAKDDFPGPLTTTYSISSLFKDDKRGPSSAFVSSALRDLRV